jgi:HSP20 family protein
MNANGVTGPAYSPLSQILGYDPFHRFFSNVEPEMSVVRSESGFELEIPVPGFSAEEIEVVCKDDLLTITGKNDRRTFTRALNLPDEIDPRSIEASVENGLLSLSLRRHPDAEPLRIQVKAQKPVTTQKAVETSSQSAG